MKIPVQYLNDSEGVVHAVQIPVNEWEKIISKINKYDTLIKLKSDLKAAFSEVEKMKKGKIKKQTLSEFLNEL